MSYRNTGGTITTDGLFPFIWHRYYKTFTDTISCLDKIQKWYSKLEDNAIWTNRGVNSDVWTNHTIGGSSWTV